MSKLVPIIHRAYTLYIRSGKFANISRIISQILPTIKWRLPLSLLYSAITEKNITESVLHQLNEFFNLLLQLIVLKKFFV